MQVYTIAALQCHVSAVQQSESAICFHISPLFWVSFPFRSPQSFLCYRVDSQLSVLCTVSIVYMSVSVSRFIPPPALSPWASTHCSHLCLCFCFANKITCTIFLNSTHTHIIFVFSFDFNLYDFDLETNPRLC